MYYIARYGWQKGDKRGLADWVAIKRMKQELGSDIAIIGNGNIGQYIDFESMVQETGVDGANASYAALINPSIFQPNSVPIAQYIGDYFNIARRYENSWIDILRHLEWMLKSYNLSPPLKALMFNCDSFEDLW